MTNCPTCGEKIKDGVFGSNSALSPERVALINEYHPEKAEQRCSKCGDDLYAIYQLKLCEERVLLMQKIWSGLAAIPILSLQAPLHWEYAVCGLVTGQST